jgi:hypothetical protein
MSPGWITLLVMLFSPSSYVTRPDAVPVQPDLGDAARRRLI